VSIRGEIVEVARRLLATHGLTSMTIRQVARTAGVDPGTVRHYFPAKDDLAQAAAGPDVDMDMSETYREVVADAPARRAGARLVAAATRCLRPEQVSRVAIAVCLTGGDYERTVFGAFDREVVTPVARDIDPAGGDERSAMVMSTFLGFELLATMLPSLKHTMRDDDVQAILAESIEGYLAAG
jgi:AcrR family transcriptional regulator